MPYYPCYIQGWDGWVSSSDSDLSEGSLRLAKFFGDDTGVLLSGNDIVVSKITVVCLVGFQDGFTVILPEVPHFVNSFLQFNGEFLDPEQYNLVRRRTQVNSYTNLIILCLLLTISSILLNIHLRLRLGSLYMIMLNLVTRLF